MKQKTSFPASLASFLAVIFAAATVFSSTAAAKGDIWADSAFDLKSVKSLYFEDVAYDLSADFDDDILERKMSDFLRRTAPKTGLRIVAKGEPHPTGLEFKTLVERWETASQVIPAYTTWENRTERREWKDRDGKIRYETRTIPVPVYHPERTVYYSTVCVRFDGYAPDGNVVYSHREERTREEANAHYKMFERIAKEFLSQFVKRQKK